jgi:hypothetical protein
MRTVDFEEFCTLPEGTIFCYLEEYPLSYYRKGESFLDSHNKPISYYQTLLQPDKVEGEPTPVIYTKEIYRDRNDSQTKYLVLEDEDVLLLVSLLTTKR